MATLQDLPFELLYRIVLHFDPRTLAKVGIVNLTLLKVTSDEFLWKQIVYKEPYHSLNVSHLTRQNIFLYAFWEMLKEEYQPLHPLYNTIKTLATTIQAPDKTDIGKAATLYQKASQGEPEEQMRYTQAIIACDEWHNLILHHIGSHWVELLYTQVLLKDSKIILQLLASTPLQTYLLSHFLGDSYLKHILNTSDKSIIDFFTHSTLKEWKKALFESPSHSRILEDLLDKMVTKSPERIPSLLENESFQQWILLHPRAGHILYKCIIASTEGPILLAKNPKESRLKERFFSDISTKNTEELAWFTHLINQHSKSTRLLTQYPETFRLLSLVDIRSFVERYPEIFILIHDGNKYYLLITPEKINLSAQFDHLMQNPAIATYLKKQKIPGLIDLWRQASCLDSKNSIAQDFVIQTHGEHKNAPIQIISISQKQLDAEYLLSRIHSNPFEKPLQDQCTQSRLVAP